VVPCRGIDYIVGNFGSFASILKARSAIRPEYSVNHTDPEGMWQ
jgi:hypothetical protein